MHARDRERDRLLRRVPRADVERLRVGVDEQRLPDERGLTRIARVAALPLLRVVAGLARRGERPYEVLDPRLALRALSTRVE